MRVVMLTRALNLLCVGKHGTLTVVQKQQTASVDAGTGTNLRMRRGGSVSNFKV